MIGIKAHLPPIVARCPQVGLRQAGVQPQLAASSWLRSLTIMGLGPDDFGLAPENLAPENDDRSPFQTPNVVSIPIQALKDFRAAGVRVRMPDPSLITRRRRC